MNTQEHLLTIVMEECAELAQRCSKALRFGVDEKQPEQRYTNAERIKEEYADLIGAMHLLSETMTGFPLDSTDVPAIIAKKRKIRKFMKYARECGTLVDDPPLVEEGAMVLDKTTAGCLYHALVSLELSCEGSAKLGTPQHTLLEVLDALRFRGHEIGESA